jgi:ribosomal protein S30
VVEERLESLLDPRIKNQRNIEVRVESNSTN